MYNKKYYLEHKQEYLDRNKKWRQENKERFYELVKKSRTKKANKLKLKGEMYAWRSEPEKKKLYEKRYKRINNIIGNGKIQDTNIEQ